MTTTPAPGADKATDERALFEKSINDARFFPAELCFARTKSPSGRDEYANSHLESCWRGWRASASVPRESEGWQFVPKVPTEEMIRAACLSQSTEKFATYAEWWDSHSGGVSEKIRRYLRDEYLSMLAAAPSARAAGAPVQQGDERSSIAIVMANVMYNFAQKRGHTLTETDCEMFDKLRKRCDAAAPYNAAPADAVVARPDLLAARAEGRAEAVLIIMAMDPEDALNDCMVGSGPCPATGEYDTNWDEAQLREKFSAGDKLFDMELRLDTAFYEYQEARMVIQYEAEQRRALPAPQAPDQTTGEKK